ncbi:hypothetical protein DAI22_05g256100 [Oryza sativa Japonica Group]|nr:hypothetical protein DAI22_05g256100 [Oryza sativa Japonica Group]KAF2932032.1 hypothetical protein DAI22_05g256100 [Oryza sativa Japonica Group]
MMALGHGGAGPGRKKSISAGAGGRRRAQASMSSFLKPSWKPPHWSLQSQQGANSSSLRYCTTLYCTPDIEQCKMLSSVNTQFYSHIYIY